MFDMPPSPPPQLQVSTECVVASSAYYNVPPEIVVTLAIQEGGRLGRVSKNSNGTVDMGPMQINSIHLDRFRRYGVSREHIINNECVNVAVGAYILRREMNDSPNDYWRAAGNYHSRTPVYHNRYLRSIQAIYLRLHKQHRNYMMYIRVLAARVRGSLRRQDGFETSLAHTTKLMSGEGLSGGAAPTAAPVENTAFTARVVSGR